MTSPSLTVAWAQLLALLAVEVGLVALGTGLLLRWSPTAGWRRTFCQAGLAAVLVITGCELSGSARTFGSWATGFISSRNEASLPVLQHALGPEPLGEPASLPAAAKSPALPRKVSAADGVSSSSVRQTTAPSAAGSFRRPQAVSGSMDLLWLCLIWVAGAALAGGRACLARCLFLVFQFRRPVVDPALAERVQALARALGIRRRVRVIQSRRLVSPIAFGLVRPTVGLPHDFARRFDALRQDAMLAHELAHLAAHDPFWCLLADMATILLWWHPAVWWLRRQLHLASEMAADEASLLVADGPAVLAECLVELGVRLTRPLLLGQLRVSGFRSHLGRRVQRLMHLESGAWSPPPRLGAALVRIFGPMALAAIVVLCTAWAAPQALTKGISMKTMQLNWKRSLATFALLTTFHGPATTVAMAQPDKPAPAPAPAPAVLPKAAASSATSQASEAPAVAKPPPAAAAAEAAFRERYGLQATPPNPPQQTDKGASGAKLEAKLKQIVLEDVKFDGLPLSEVLIYLNDQSIKHSPDKAGINFLINPNFPPVSLTGKFDPATGLPLATTSAPFDVGGVIIKFNMPLRNVTMKEVLDAIVTVADHPIEYSLEDYGVVFSAKPVTLGGQPVLVAPPGPPPEQAQASAPKPEASWSKMIVVRPGKDQEPNVEVVDVKPQPFNVDFGPDAGTLSEQQGPAAVGKEGDFWNSVVVPWNDHHTEGDLKFANGVPCPIQVEMMNLGGHWSAGGSLGVESPMFDTYAYPAGNKGGNSTVILHHVPPGKYNLYIYGHGNKPLYYGDYTLTVDSHDYGRKTTYHKGDTGQKTKWVEGYQYVKFSNVKVGLGDEMKILIRPGGVVTDPSGRSFADAIIFGLQLIPVK